ncbi:MAG: DNA polymerase III subunit delta' [Dichotomicrobium sp.]
MARAARQTAETPAPTPEADRLGDWPHPRETAGVIGHDAARARLGERLRTGRIAHGWIVAGPPGIGKATLVYDFAAEALAHGVEAAEETRRLVAAQAHPRLMVMRRTLNPQTKKLRTRIAVDDVRRLKHFLGTTAGAGWRVVIVDYADDLNASSANALLKSLEEPPARTLFFLIATSAGRLLPTIASRCERLRLRPLSHEETGRAVEAVCGSAGAEPPEADTLEAILSAANGRPRRALELMAAGGAELQAAVRRIFERLPRMDDAEVFRLIDTAGNAKSGIGHDLVFDLVEDALAAGIRDAAHSPETPGVFNARSLARWMEVWDTGKQLRADAETLNLDRAAALMRLFTVIEDAARQAQRAVPD